MKTLKVFVICAVLAATAAIATGCSYGAVTAVSGDRVVVVRNDNFLFGALRHVYVCKATDAGLTNCAETEAP